MLNNSSTALLLLGGMWIAASDGESSKSSACLEGSRNHFLVYAFIYLMYPNPLHRVEEVIFPDQHAAVQVLLIHAWNARQVQCQLQLTY